MRFIPEHRPITVIAGLFDLVNIRNRGAAFGFLNRSDIEWQFWLFLVATIVAVWAIIMLARSSSEDPWLITALGLVMNYVRALRKRPFFAPTPMPLYGGRGHTSLRHG